MPEFLADSSPNWYLKSHTEQLPLGKLYFEFGTVKLLEFAPNIEQLKIHSNAFGLLTAAHLLTQATKHKPLERKQGKLELTRLLYKNGWHKEKIEDFFAILDWLISLPPQQELNYKDELIEIREEYKMCYVTSIERLCMEEGFIDGLEQGLEKGRLESLKEAIINLHRNMQWGDKQIAAALQLPVEKVEHILAELKA